MTVTAVVMPRLGLTMEEGTLVGWLKAEGDSIIKGEDLMEVEIDKGTVVAAAPASGVLRAVRAQPGAVVPVGQTVGYIAESMDEVIADAAPNQNAAVAPEGNAPPPRDTDQRPPIAEVRAAPAARRRAAELGIDLGSLVGTGPGGRITSEDVERARQADSARQAVQAGAAHRAAVTRPLSRIRIAVADLMCHSQQMIPQFAVRACVDATALLATCAQVMGTSPVDAVVQACAAALVAYPEANATFRRISAESAELVLHQQIGIGLAVATAAGLLVPVIPNANRLSLTDISTMRHAVVARARAGRLTTADLAETALTVSNLGPMGAEDFTAMVIPPQAAILAVGKIQEGPIVRDGRVAAAPLVRLSLTVDHRILDGAAASQLLGAIVQHLQTRPEAVS